MALFDSLITIIILFSLFIIIYCKYMNKTLPEFFSELRDVFRPQEEEVINLR
ncbi:hypothetical protein LCGC14_0571200 [marine sediment metagenome]|uniref:Uncharacterized protein n=1 Tax=marine sediment metagenome TaxID=412755 RepID=A0A0F9S2S9_9ZZZZ